MSTHLHRPILLTLTALSLLLAACDDANEFGTDNWQPSLTGHYLSFPTTAISIAADGSATSHHLQAVTTPWRFSGMASWLTVNPTQGDGDATVSFSATANLSGEHSRTSVFSLQSTAADYPFTQTVAATQLAATPTVTLSHTALTAPAATSQVSVNVAANVAWTLSSSPSWITPSVSSDSTTITFRLAENLTDDTRSATFRLTTTTTAQATLTITQAAASDPVVAGATLHYPSSGGVYQLSLESEVAWTTEASASWVEVAPAEGGAGTHTLTVTALPNASLSERTAFVYISIGSARRLSIPVTQDGIYLRLSTASLSLAAAAEEQTISLESNTTWQVLEQPSWLTITPTEGSGDATISIVPDDYWDTTSRTGRIRIGQEATGLISTIAVTQQGRTFPDLIASLSFTDKGGTQEFELQTDGRWTATVSHPWLSVSPAEGTGSATLTVTAEENPTDDSRLASVTVTVGSSTQTIAVAQSGKYFTVEPTAFSELPSTGGYHTVHIATNEAWQATSTSTWIELSQRSGDADIDVTLTAPDNPSVIARRDTTTFTPAHLQPVRVVTAQAARYLRISAAALSFFARHSRAETVTVTTDAAYTVTTQASWLHITRSGDTFSVIPDDNDTEADRTAIIRIAATDLRDGETLVVELPVTQYLFAPGVSLTPYADELSWNIYASAAATISITAFATDASWNPSGAALATISITTFGEEEHW